MRVLQKFDRVIDKDIDFTRLRQICDGAFIDPLSIYNILIMRVLHQ